MIEDVVMSGLDILFVGYNPSLASAARGHHFAGPGNLFWALLADAGLTSHRLTPEQDRDLLLWKLGIINLVDRPTATAAELQSPEIEAGAQRLKLRLTRLKPRIACFLGKDIFRAVAGRRPAERIDWGLQQPSWIPSVMLYVAPNPSRRSTIPYGLRLRYFRELKNLLQWSVPS